MKRDRVYCTKKVYTDVCKEMSLDRPMLFSSSLFFEANRQMTHLVNQQVSSIVRTTGTYASVPASPHTPPR